jgi:transcriptional regulator with XRE-family HTH domain
MNITNVVGDNIRGFRKKRKWTQARLGEECNLSGNYIGDIERGEYHLTLIKLFDIAKALKISPHFFLIEGAYKNTPDELKKALSL